MRYFSLLILILLSIISFSCKERSEYSINEIQIPKYYKEYDFRKYWESNGINFTFSNMHSRKKGYYKDNVSKNFLNISEMQNGVLFLDKEERIKHFKDEMNFDSNIINEGFEIYQAKNVDTILNKPIYKFSTCFIIKKDSACFSIDYMTFDKDKSKINDYENIVNKIKTECVKGSIFKSTLKSIPPKKVIAN